MTPISQSAKDHTIQIGQIEHVGSIAIGSGANHSKEQSASNSSYQLQVQIGSLAGSVVNIHESDPHPTFKARNQPILLRPRSCSSLLDRTHEVHAALDALLSNRPVEFYGPRGIGKTALIRYLAYHPALLSQFSDGIIYHRLGDYQSIADLLQILFDALYESNLPCKLTNSQIYHALSHKKVLVLLDDATLGREQTEALLNALPSLTFLFCSTERQLWGEGYSTKLQGLPEKDAILLVQRELNNAPMQEKNTKTLKQLCKAFKGHPLRLLQVLSQVREQNLPLTLLVSQARATSFDHAIMKHRLALINEDQKRLLGFLGSISGIALTQDQIRTITGIQDPRSLLEQCLEQHLIEIDRLRYHLTSNLVKTLPQTWNLSPYAKKITTYFTHWIASNGENLNALHTESEPLLQVLRQAVKDKQWATVLHLGLAIEGVFAIDGQWDRWEVVLQWIHEAAHASGDSTSEAFALHQLGTRSICLHELDTAYEMLYRAFDIRQERLHDPIGAQKSSHNLQVLLKSYSLNAVPPLPTASPLPRIPQTQSKLPITFFIIALGSLLSLMFWLTTSPPYSPNSTPTSPSSSPAPPPEPEKVVPSPSTTPGPSPQPKDDAILDPQDSEDEEDSLNPHPGDRPIPIEVDASADHEESTDPDDDRDDDLIETPPLDQDTSDDESNHDDESDDATADDE